MPHGALEDDRLVQREAHLRNAVVIGEPARAFYGNQFAHTFRAFAHYGVEL